MKILLWAIGAVVAGFILLLVAAVLLFNPNDFRAQISAQADKSIHRKLEIGDIHLSIFPTLGARIRQVSLGNAEGFGEEPMAQIGEAEVGVRLLPLVFSRRAEISSITLKDLKLNLLKHADGKSNWDDLSGKKTPAPSPSQPQPRPTNQAAPAQLGKIGSIDISNASVAYTDQQAKKSYALNGFSFSTGSISIGKPFDFKLAFAAVLADPALTADVTASAKLDADASRPIFDLQNLELSVNASGKGVPGGKQQLKFTGGVHYDGDQGSFKLADGKLTLANLVVKTSIDGSGLDGDAARFAGPLTVEGFDPRETFKALGMQAPETADASALKQVSVAAQLEAGKTSARLNSLTVKLDQSTLTGTVKLPDFSSGAVQFALKLDQIDADRYMAPAKRNPVAAPTAADNKPGQGDDTPLPLDKLDTFNASGTAEIGKLKLKNLNLSNVQLKLAAAKGAPKTVDLNAALYGGSLASNTRVTPGARPGLAESLKLAGINAGPLLIDFMGKDYVTGTGNFGLDITGAGRTVGELKRALNGSVNAALQNGAVKGFNLAQLIRQGQAIYSGQAPEKSDAGQQTDFTSMTVSGKITNGILHSDDLAAATPLLRITGAGDVNLVNSTLDYTAQPTVVNTATGQGGKELANLNGVVIPVRVYGPFAQPKYQLDVATALKQQAVQKLTQKLGDKLGGKLGNGNNQKANDAVNLLQGLFGKKQNQQQQQTPPK